MNAVDRLAFRWQFESFTPEYQEASYQEMLADFAKAWTFKRNRSYIQMRLNQLADRYPDLMLIQRFLTDLFDKDPKHYTGDADFLAKDWSKYDVRKTKKDAYIGPDAYRQM